MRGIILWQMLTVLEWCGVISVDATTLPNTWDSFTGHAHASDAGKYLKSANDRRDKRDDDLPDVPQEFKPELFEGTALPSIWWVVRKDDDVKLCLANFVDKQVAVCPCSCVTTIPPGTHPVNATTHEGWIVTELGESVLAMDHRDLKLVPYYSKQGTTEKEVTSVYPHPNCTTLFRFNTALIVTPVIEEVKVTWVHSPEEIVFSSNRRRIVAGQSVASQCFMPYHNPKTPDKAPQFWPVNFQHWDACRDIVCPHWSRSFPRFQDYLRELVRHGLQSKYVRNVCVDRVDDTKMCILVTRPIDAWFDTPDVEPIEPTDKDCFFPEGTPLYCLAGRIEGLMGYIVGKTFECSQNLDMAIFQPLDISMKWMRKSILTRLDPTYNDEDPNHHFNNPLFPRWIQAIDKKRPPTIDQHPIQQHFPVAGPEVDALLEVWADRLAETIVNVWWAVKDNKRILCQGTQVALRHFVVPCYCWASIAFPHLYVDDLELKWGPEKFTYLSEDIGTHINISKEFEIKAKAVPSNLLVRLAKHDWWSEECSPIANEVDYKTFFGDKPKYLNYSHTPYCYGVQEVFYGKKCNNGRFGDFGMVKTTLPIRFAKSAWIHTSNVAYFEKAMDILPVSSLVEGKCFFINFTYIAPQPELNIPMIVKTERIPIKFAPWFHCMSYICDPLESRNPVDYQELCYNWHILFTTGDITPWNQDRNRFPENYRDCISASYNMDLCKVVDGTPIFCDTDELRGFVGFISKINMLACNNTTPYEVKLPDGSVQKRIPEQVLHDFEGQSSAIIMRIDGYLEDFKNLTVIYELENNPKARKRSGGPPSHTVAVDLLLASTLISRL